MSSSNTRRGTRACGSPSASRSPSGVFRKDSEPAPMTAGPRPIRLRCVCPRSSRPTRLLPPLVLGSCPQSGGRHRSCIALRPAARRMREGLVATAHSAVDSSQAAPAAPLQAVVSSGTWAAKPPMPGVRNEVIAVAAAGKIFVLGGSLRQDDYALTRNEEYDPATGAWRARAPLPSGASHMAAAVLDGTIYAIGGFTGRDHKGPVERVFAYDIAVDAWRALPPLAVPRGSLRSEERRVGKE